MRRFTLPARSSTLVCRFALLALLPIGAAWMPPRLAAKEPAPAPHAASASSSQAAPAPDSEPSEKEQKDAYRHTPLVQSLAKLVHLDVETMARILEVLNFGIVVLGIGIPLFRFLPKYLRQRGEKVRADIESARKVTEDANARLSAVEARLAHLGDEIAKFRVEVEAEMREDEVRIKAALEEESVRIVASAEQEIGVAAAQARRGLRHFAAGLAIDQAAREIALTPEIDRALIAEFVRDASRTGMAKGGQN